MSKHNLCRTITLRVCLLFLVAVSSLSAQPGISSGHEPDELNRRLNLIRKELLVDQRTTLQKMEEAHLKLAVEFSSDAAKGRVFAHLAHLLLEGKAKDPDKSLKYAEMALQKPLGVMDTVSTHITVADAMSFKSAGIKGEAYVGIRRSRLTELLQALKLVLNNLTENERQPSPHVTRLGGIRGTDTKAYEDGLRKQRDMELAEWDRVEFQNELLRKKRDIIFSCVLMYTYSGQERPADPAELEQTAKQILTPAHDDVTRTIVDSLAACIQFKKRNGNIVPAPQNCLLKGF